VSMNESWGKTINFYENYVPFHEDYGE